MMESSSLGVLISIPLPRIDTQHRYAVVLSLTVARVGEGSGLVGWPGPSGRHWGQADELCLGASAVCNPT
jgi:hypothetical protein